MNPGRTILTRLQVGERAAAPPRRLANEAGGPHGRASPFGQAGDRRRHASSCIVLTGHAIRVPHRRVNPGPQRTATVNLTGPISWPSLARPARTHPANMPDEVPGSSPGRPTILAVTSENADQSVLSNAVSFCASHAHSGLRTHPCRDHQVLSEACVRSAETVRRPHQPGGLCFAPSTSALWGECRQPSALTAGRPGDAQPVSFSSGETGVAIVAGRSRRPSQCGMHQVMLTGRSGFAQRLTRQRMDRRANPSRTVGAATVTAERIRLLARAWGFATVPRLAIPQRGKAWRDWARRSAMALTAGRCRGDSLP